MPGDGVIAPWVDGSASPVSVAEDASIRLERHCVGRPLALAVEADCKARSIGRAAISRCTVEDAH